MTAVIRETNVFSDLFKNIYSKISTISDPGGKSKWIFSSFPESKIKNKAAYPMLVIAPAEVSFDPLTFKTIKRGPVTITIDVYTVNAAQIDTISDSVANTMKTNEDNGSFNISGIQTMRLTNTDTDAFSVGKFRVHNRTFDYEFDFGWY